MLFLPRQQGVDVKKSGMEPRSAGISAAASRGTTVIVRILAIEGLSVQAGHVLPLCGLVAEQCGPR